ncbi:MAG: hypothetical protein HY069_05080 [Chlamydiia bacterium]|nr:hypothetical protein [Chlamydiia bacterium]
MFVQPLQVTITPEDPSAAIPTIPVVAPPSPARQNTELTLTGRAEVAATQVFQCAHCGVTFPNNESNIRTHYLKGTWCWTRDQLNREVAANQRDARRIDLNVLRPATPDSVNNSPELKILTQPKQPK